MLDEYDVDYPRLLLLCLTVAVVVAVVVAASTTSTAFSVYNPSWEGASDLRRQADAAGAESRVVLNTTAYETTRPNETAAVVIAPERTYSPTERDRMRQFVRRGGTLVVADDFGGQTTPLLRALGLDARLDGGLLRDERHNYRSSALPEATNVTDAPLTDGVDRLTLNYGTVVRPGNATVLVRSSEFGYVDRNRNGKIDGNETLASRPVAVTETVGRGRVVVVSDASVFINAMLDRPGNRRFARNVFAPEERVLLDYSHASAQPPLAVALLRFRQAPTLQALFGLLGLGAVGLWGARGGTERRRGDADGSANDGTLPSDDALVSYLAGRHPEFEAGRLSRVMTAIMSDRSEEESDE